MPLAPASVVAVVAVVAGPFVVVLVVVVLALLAHHSGALDTPVVGTGYFFDGRVRPIYGALDSERLPAYHRPDLRADAQFSPRWSAYFEIVNAYNRANVFGYSYSADYRTREKTQQLPILPSAGAKFSF